MKFVFQATSSTLKQKIKENHVKLVNSLDVCLLEHLLPGYLKISLEERQGRKPEIRAILERLARSPDSITEEFANVLAGLYPDIFREIAGRSPSASELSK